MHERLKPAVGKLLDRQDLSSDEVRDCIGAVMDGECDAVDIAALLTAMAAKGPVATELAGAARAMRERAAKIPTRHAELLDTCGTGGDRLHTFNISTATAIVAAACGIPVAKHGNRSVSSSSGSADVLEALGVNIALTPEAAGRCLDETGIAFCFAPVVHGAMKHVAPVRKQLGFPTIFNLLGPLTNPAGARFQLLGAASLSRATLIAAALTQLGGSRVFVACGNDQIDEVCLWGTTTILDVRDTEMRRLEVSAATFGLPECCPDDLTVCSARESAAVIREVFSEQRRLSEHCTPAAGMIVANTAAALVVTGRFDDFRRAAAEARNVLASGAALRKLEQLVDVSNTLM